MTNTEAKVFPYYFGPQQVCQHEKKWFETLSQSFQMCKSERIHCRTFHYIHYKLYLVRRYICPGRISHCFLALSQLPNSKFLQTFGFGLNEKVDLISSYLNFTHAGRVGQL